MYQAKEELLVAVGQLKKWKATKLAIPSFFPQDEAKAYTLEHSSFITEAQQLAEAQVLLFQIFAEQTQEQQRKAWVLLAHSAVCQEKFCCHQADAGSFGNLEGQGRQPQRPLGGCFREEVQPVTIPSGGRFC